MKPFVFDLTMPFDGTVRALNRWRTRVLTSSRTLDKVQRTSEVQVAPHGVTHRDLSGRLNLDYDAGQQLMEDYAPARTKRAGRVVWRGKATLVFLRQKLVDMSERFSDWWPSSGLPTHMNQCLPPDKFREAIKAQRIDAEALKGLDIPPGNAVVFVTGWRRFLPRNADVSHVGWYPWHPFLLAPYLDEDAAKYLTGDLQVPLIGCDIGTLDSPLRYRSLFPIVNPDVPAQPEVPDKVTQLWRSTHDWSYAVSRIKGHLRYYPLHAHAVASGAFLVEQLWIPPLLVAMVASLSAPEAPYYTAECSLFCTQVACSVAREATPVCVLACMKGEGNAAL